MQSYRFKLPVLPPSVNATYKTRMFRDHSMMYKDGGIRDFEDAALQILPRPKEMMHGWIGIHLTFTISERFSQKDGDNMLKVLIDILAKKGVFENDGHICSYRITKKPGPDDSVAGLVFLLRDPSLPPFKRKAEKPFCSGRSPLRTVRRAR